MSSTYNNPYSGQSFFGFFEQLFLRIGQFVQGNLSSSDIVSDEIQMLVLIGVACSSAMVGSFLVLRKMTMLANSLSHTILLGIVMAYFFTNQHLLDVDHAPSINLQSMLIASLVMGLLTTFFTEFLTKSAKLQEDASTGLVFTTLFALGIISVTLLTRDSHIGTEVVMGNVDALQLEDCLLVYSALAMNLVLFTLFFKEFKITTFDGGLSKALGISTLFFNYLLMVQVSVTVVGAFRAVGALMVLAFITGPALTARLLTHNLKTMIAYAMLIGSLASILGVATSRHVLSAWGIPLTTGGVIVCLLAGFFMMVALLKYLINKPRSNIEQASTIQ